MKSYTVEEYINAECPQMSDFIMHAVHGETGGRLCDTGCFNFNSGRCAAYQRLIRPKYTIQKKQTGETVRAEAARRGISIKQVRRERADARCEASK